ncbi:peptidyl-tRNA hydrolase [Cryptosporangium aurantiacum]|uniref:peptidyl-tRNA hydrolase n=1 Tax=Cryptosporangium aurantiacum TaxID=134849 RepID=A0A1M7TV01_9ACTN|nr:peptidyl-tRNA hydrolase [Cryptosporangium aurantiacum]SHN74518.1 Peptidyl-tRNA hydrolase [Cryptosporangium aurantiacum]
MSDVERVLPLVVRVERAEPPTRTDALEAAARAVLVMVTTAEPDWRDAVDAWQGNRIRKVVRRARGSEWRRAAELPGVTVQSGTAEVRVYPPIPVDEWPRDLARLQVSGTELDDPAAPGVPDPGTPLVLLSPDVEMTAGKAMAQAGHAAQLGLWSLDPAVAARWAADGFPLAVRTASGAQWAAARRSGAPVVRDAGFTEVTPGSATAAFVFAPAPVAR